MTYELMQAMTEAGLVPATYAQRGLVRIPYEQLRLAARDLDTDECAYVILSHSRTTIVGQYTAAQVLWVPRDHGSLVGV
jgi:hypothetical protein